MTLYEYEIERATDQLSRTNFTDPNYKTLIEVIGSLYELCWAEKDWVERDNEKVIKGFTEESRPFKPTPEEIISKEVVPAELPPQTFPEEPKKEENAEPTKEEVRALLASKAKEGIVIENILAKYVPEGKPHKFSSIKSSDYAAIVEDLNHAV